MHRSSMEAAGAGSPRYPPEVAIVEALHATLRRIPDPVTLLFSGGVDSGLLAHCLRELGRRPHLLAIGVEGARDLATAASAAAQLGLNVECRTLSVGEVREALEDPALSASGLPEPIRSVRVALDLAMRSARGPTVVCGQGADELFGGYSRYRGQTAPQAERLRGEDLRRLLEIDWPWTVDRGRALGVDIRAPYLAPEVRAAATALPWPPGGIGPRAKDGFRELARAHGLPAEIADRSKRALQYGSGVRYALPGPALPHRGREPL